MAHMLTRPCPPPSSYSPVPPPLLKASKPRVTVTDDDRTRICLYAKENPHAKHGAIGTLFGFERSTVSKVLRHTEKVRKRCRGPQVVPVGYWRESDAVNDADKHLCYALIDTRDRLRTRLHKATRDGRPISKESVPFGPTGSWVTFDRIVFEELLVGLDHTQVKKYVKLRLLQMDAGETEEQAAKNMRTAVAEVKKRVHKNPPPETPNGTQIAYGKDIPEHAIATRPDNKRRRLLGPSGSSPQASPDISMVRATMVPALAPSSTSRYFLNPLPGTRPTKILLGYWAGSSEANDLDKHAVFGVLGANDTFRVKVTREPRDGRTVIGNFPTGAGALWINFEEVIFEPHLSQLSRSEIKEYTRVRQRQLDDGETPDLRMKNETTAVSEAKRRVGVQQAGGEIRPLPPAILPKPANDASADTADDLDSIVKSVRPKRVLTPNRPELRKRAVHAFPAPGTTEPVNRGPVNSKVAENTIPARRTCGPVPFPTEVRAINRDTQPPPPIQQSSHAPDIHAECYTVALAQAGIKLMEQAHMHTRQRDVSRDSMPRGSFTSDARPTINANHGPPTGINNLGSHNPNTGAASSGNGRAEQVMARERIRAEQEMNRVRATGSEDEKVYNGIKYERKQTGPFAGNLTFHGNTITIDGVEYVEYRILMVLSFS